MCWMWAMGDGRATWRHGDTDTGIDNGTHGHEHGHTDTCMDTKHTLLPLSPICSLSSRVSRNGFSSLSAASSAQQRSRRSRSGLSVGSSSSSSSFAALNGATSSRTRSPTPPYWAQRRPASASVGQRRRTAAAHRAPNTVCGGSSSRTRLRAYSLRKRDTGGGAGCAAPVGRTRGGRMRPARLCALSHSARRAGAG